jgi:multidrug efflux pump subunit AcrA (membrane-fusion protein)
MKLRQRIRLGCLLCAALSVGCNKVQSYEKPLTPVQVKAAARQALSGGAVRYAANIQPRAQVELAFKLSGYVAELLQVRGRVVQAGD